MRQRIIVTLDKALDWCVENWRAMVVLLPASTFVFFTVVLFFGLTVNAALAITKTLVVLECIAIGAIVALNLKYRRQISLWLDAADTIDAMISKDDVFLDWDEFLTEPAGDPLLERIRLHCLTLPRDFPPVESGDFCNQYGVAILQGYQKRLRVGLVTRAMASWSVFWSVRRAKKLAEMDWPEDDAGDGFEALGNMPDGVSDPIPAAPMKLDPPSTATPIPPLPEDTPSTKANTTPAGKKPAKKAAAKKTAARKSSTKKATKKKAKKSRNASSGRRVA